jgi:hypothetical protein
MMPITQEAFSKMRPTSLLLLILIITSVSTKGNFIVVVLILHADGYHYNAGLEHITMQDLSLRLIRTCIPVVITSLVLQPLLYPCQFTQQI